MTDKLTKRDEWLDDEWLDRCIGRLLAEHARHEKLPRAPCPECQFEANAERAPHAPGCSEGGDDAVARRREQEGDC